MRKLYGLLVFVVLAALVLSACGAPQEGSQLVCPTVFIPGSSVCVVGSTTSDPNQSVYEAVYVGLDQVAVYKASSETYALYETPGYHPTPSKYARVYYTNSRTLVSEYDPANCPNKMYDNECVTTLSDNTGVTLKDNVMFDASYKLSYSLVFNGQDNLRDLYEVGGYSELMIEFNDVVRDVFRDSRDLDSNDWIEGTLAKTDVAENWLKKLPNHKAMTSFKYHNLFSFEALSVRYFQPPSMPEESSLTTSEDLRKASSIATQWAISCSEFVPGSAERLVCECNYNNANFGLSADCTSGINIISPALTPTLEVVPNP